MGSPNLIVCCPLRPLQIESTSSGRHHRSHKTNAPGLSRGHHGYDNDRRRFGIHDSMGSSIADEDSECMQRFVTIEHENPIPNPYPSYIRYFQRQLH